MPVRKDEANCLLREMTGELFTELEVRIDRLLTLFEDDDWAFVVKVHALIEATLSQAISGTIGDERLSTFVDRLTFANEATGKLALARALGLLDGPARTFVRHLSQLRNRLVHDIRLMEFSFSTYLSSLSPEEQDRWRSSILWFPLDDEARAVWNQIAIENGKIAIWMATVVLMGTVLIDAAQAKGSRSISEAALQTAEELCDALSLEDP